MNAWRPAAAVSFSDLDRCSVLVRFDLRGFESGIRKPSASILVGWLQYHDAAQWGEVLQCLYQVFSTCILSCRASLFDLFLS